MLTFESAAIKIVIEEHAGALKNIEPTDGWGCGSIINNFAGASGAFFWLLGRKDRTPGVNSLPPSNGTEGATNEYFHPIARIRQEKLKYKPKPLDKYAPKSGGGWVWASEEGQTVPEYVMRPEKKMTVAYEEGGRMRFGVGDSLSRLLCPKSILADLDRVNGIRAK